MNLTASDIKNLLTDVSANLSTVIKGKEDKIELVLLALIAGGHVLIEDIPGVGKTTLARALAKTIDGRFHRIQFTPDLLPTDITGINIFIKED
ncbi:MAG: AAA family ATPase, partial [Candidatus Omnitrophica bacterium]|nr:AAA family ATPase [Candidatus Omnitrophota bacterium]